MAINTAKEIASVAYNGVEIPLKSSGALTPATLTINSTDYTGVKYANILYLTPDGEIVAFSASESGFTFPLVLNTVLYSSVSIVPAFGGIPHFENAQGCLVGYAEDLTCIVPTSETASVTVVNKN